jgi:hypothetical protein
VRVDDVKLAYPLTARSLLMWSLVAAAAIEVFRYTVDRSGFTSIFAHLFYRDAVANWVLMMLVLCAYLLRRRSDSVLAAIQAAGSRPWLVAAVLFPLLCLGTLRIYHDHPLSMDEYAAVFQAKAFAAGRLSGAFPPDLLDALIPVKFQNYFLTVSRASGEASSSYWPGFALLSAPFAWLNATWMANPAIGALAVPVVHHLTREVTGSREAAAWAVVITAASPVFIVNSISYYSMQAHLLCNMLFALLLLRPTAPRAAVAGLIGSFALTLHQPVPHLLFLIPFAIWLALRPGSIAVVAALAIGYLPLGLLLGLGWQFHLVELVQAGAAATISVVPGPSLADASLGRISRAFSLPNAAAFWANGAGLTKAWTWGAAGLVVLAAFGYAAARANPAIRVLGAAVLVTVLGYFFYPVDQGHGWGYRYLHSAWFVLPLFAAAGLAASGSSGRELRAMAAWLVVLSFVFANSLRLAEVWAFTAGHLAHVPPLARQVPPDVRQIVFVSFGAGPYVEDLVQNDPFLRASRIVMVYEGPERAADLMRRRFPGYVREFSSHWGELWTVQRPAEAR